MEKSKRKVFKRVMAWLLSIVMLLSVSQWDMFFVSHAQGDDGVKFKLRIEYGEELSPDFKPDYTEVTLKNTGNETIESKSDFTVSGSAIEVSFTDDSITEDIGYNIEFGGFEKYNDVTIENINEFDVEDGMIMYSVEYSEISKNLRKKTYSINVNENVTLNKNGTYSITNGSITIAGGNGEGGLFEHGNSLSITVNADTEYYISDINPEANVNDDATSATVNIDDISENYSFDVEFKKKTYSIKVNDEQITEYGVHEVKDSDTKTGEIKIYNGDNKEKTGKFEHGDKVCISINSIDNYAISEISGSALELLYLEEEEEEENFPVEKVIGEKSVNLNAKYGITSNIDLTICFAQHNIECIVDNEERGSAYACPTFVPYGGTATYHIWPAAGYKLEGIYKADGNGNVVTDAAIVVESEKINNDNNKLEIIVKESLKGDYTEDKNIKRIVKFEEIGKYTMSSYETWRTFVSYDDDNIVYEDGDDFIIKKDEVLNLYSENEDEMICININEGEGYKWSSWQKSISISKSTVIKEIILGKFNEAGDAEYKRIVFDEDKEIKIAIPTATPSVEIIKNDKIGKWTKEDVIVKVKCTEAIDEVTGLAIPLNKVATKSETDKVEIEADKDNNKYMIDVNGYHSFTMQNEQNETYSIIATDIAGNDSESKDVKVMIDKTIPKVNGIYLSANVNQTQFGNYCKESVDVTVDSEDDGNIQSDINKIILYLDDEIYGTMSKNENKIEINNIINKKVSAIVVDNAGWESDRYILRPTAKPTDAHKLMIETVIPEIDITIPEPIYKSGDKVWYNDNINYNVNVADNEAGLNDVKISINGVEREEDNSSPKKKVGEFSTEEKVIEESYQIATGYEKDGEYTINVEEVKDNAGNSASATKTVYLDKTPPTIVGFDFEAREKDQNDPEYPNATPKPTSTSEPIVATEYGYYFMKDCTVTVTATDVNGELPSSGVKQICYYYNGTDIDGKELFGKYTIGVDKNKISFDIAAGFKGVVGAYAIDNVNNSTNSYVTPKGTILENLTQHKKEKDHIKFEMDKPVTSLKSVPLYNNDTQIILTVKDTYSGLAKVEWIVDAPYDKEKNKSERIKVDNKGALSFADENWKKIEGVVEGWKDIQTDNNLITSMSRNITVSNNSNDIEVIVTITDRSGNTSTDKINLSIDKTKPTVKIDYDNDSDDQDNKDYYKANRKATITVTERNFDKDEFEVEVTNTDGELPAYKKLKWGPPQVDSKNPDNTTRTAEIEYSADGDYTFEIVKCLDMADNSITKNNKKALKHEFTIDKTEPIVNVTYDNADSLNGNYFKANRTATITINEHNFNSERVVITGSTKGQSNATFPALNGWTSNGDVHTTTIDFTDNALYSFDIDFMDMAGNESADYSVDEFYVDKTEPEIVFENVADKTPYNDEIAPIVKFTDENFDPTEVSVSIRGLNYNKKIDVPDPKSIANGQEFAFANFEKKQSMDDIYMLEAEMMDKAGNKLEKSIMFSVNRFGSVYMIDEQVEEIKGKYVQSERDIVFSEYNVNKLKHDSILLKLTKNGTPTDLVENQDYVVEKKETDESQWSEYKYTVNKSLFQTDGMYSIAVYSVDEAGNVNENINEKKKAEIEFGIDKTMPVVVPLDVESGKQYPLDNKSVTISVKDNLVLDNVEIFLNEKRIEYTNEGENYSFDVPSSSSKQDIKVMAYDAAGNICELAVENFLVTTNLFIRWFNNTPLFVGSIVGVALIGTALASYLLFFRKGLRKVTNK